MLPRPVPSLPADLVEGATLLADRNSLLPLLPKRGTFVEVGVAVGGFSRKVLDACEASRFVAVDNFLLHELPEFWGRLPSEHFGNLSHLEWFTQAFAEEITSGRMLVLAGDSAEQLERLPDNAADVIYIDGDHSYEGISRDLSVAVRKVRLDGWILVNDYILVDQLGASEPYGVIYATHEFMIQHDWAITHFALQTNMFCDVALRRGNIANALRSKSLTHNQTLAYSVACNGSGHPPDRGDEQPGF